MDDTQAHSNISFSASTNYSKERDIKLAPHFKKSIEQNQRYLEIPSGIPLHELKSKQKHNSESYESCALAPAAKKMKPVKEISKQEISKQEISKQEIRDEAFSSNDNLMLSSNGTLYEGSASGSSQRSIIMPPKKILKVVGQAIQQWEMIQDVANI